MESHGGAWDGVQTLGGGGGGGVVHLWVLQLLRPGGTGLVNPWVRAFIRPVPDLHTLLADLAPPTSGA